MCGAAVPLYQRGVQMSARAMLLNPGSPSESGFSVASSLRAAAAARKKDASAGVTAADSQLGDSGPPPALSRLVCNR